MRFEFRLEGPAEACGTNCRKLIFASGPILADTERDFTRFVGKRDLSGALVVLESEGGSVHAALDLGRHIRKLGLDTTVGRKVELDRDKDTKGERRASISPRADCQSMCPFVLLAGVHRTVPEKARVMVHQIWLGDRREDPAAGSYSADDLSLVQRDIGKIAQYTVEMGGSIEILDLAVRVPPWERMHNLTRDEIRSTRLANLQDDIKNPPVALLQPAPAPAAAPPGAPTAAPPSPPAAPPAALPPARAGAPPAGDGMRAAIADDKKDDKKDLKKDERKEAATDPASSTVVLRSQPLTVEGEKIGTFDLTLACSSAEAFEVSYIERRRTGDRSASANLRTITLNVGEESAKLKVTSSKRGDSRDEMLTTATGTVPASLVDALARADSRSASIQTRSEFVTTDSRVSTAGGKVDLPQFAANCRKPVGERADLAPSKERAPSKELAPSRDSNNGGAPHLR